MKKKISLEQIDRDIDDFVRLHGHKKRKSSLSEYALVISRAFERGVSAAMVCELLAKKYGIQVNKSTLTSWWYRERKSLAEKSNEVKKKEASVGHDASPSNQYSENPVEIPRIIYGDDESGVEFPGKNGKYYVADADGPVYLFADVSTVPGVCREMLDSSQYDGTLQNMIVCIVEREGPICLDAVVRRIASLHGLARISASFKQRIRNLALSRVIETAEYDDDDGEERIFLWGGASDINQEVEFRQPAVESDVRSVHEICMQELRGLARHVSDSGVVDESKLLKKMVQRIGMQKSGAKCKQRLKAALVEFEKHGGYALRNLINVCRFSD